MSNGNWAHPRSWINPSEPEDRRMHKEVFVHRMLTSINETDHIVGYRASAHFKTWRMYRMYTDNCPHGDLADVVDKHLQLRNRGQRDRGARKEEYKIPEDFIWSVLKGLVQAALVMAIGKGDFEKPDKVAWKEVVHLDIKSANVFLAKPDTAEWPADPVPQVSSLNCWECSKWLTDISWVTLVLPSA